MCVYLYNIRGLQMGILLLLLLEFYFPYFIKQILGVKRNACTLYAWFAFIWGKYLILLRWLMSFEVVCVRVHVCFDMKILCKFIFFFLIIICFFLTGPFEGRLWKADSCLYQAVDSETIISQKGKWLFF